MNAEDQLSRLDGRSGLLEGRVAAITGGASGIGRRTAQLFAEAGATVAVLDRAIDAAAETVAELDLIAATGHLAVEVDVAQLDSVEAAFSGLREQLGGVDVLMNSAGIREIVGPLEISEEEWNRVLAVNLSGTFFCAREAARAMIEGDGGSIINISSAVGLAGFAKRPAYAATKAGVIGITRSLAKDLGPHGIRANVIAPGLLRTPLTEMYYDDEEWVAGLPEHIPLGRPGNPEDIAGTALFLASDLSRYVSGVTLPVDGGFIGAGTFGQGKLANAEVSTAPPATTEGEG